jgi:UDP-2,3-diacylglucosamine pyrophosphatase LpxH
MLLHVMSDLHFEFDGDFRAPDVAADVLVLAGDIQPGTAGLARFADAGLPVIYVPGNHEYYGHHFDETNAELRAAAKSLGIHLLDNDEAVVGGVRFLGSTLWTDFRLDGELGVPRAMQAAGQLVFDFKSIRYAGSALLTPKDTVLLHRQSVEWLAQKLDEPFPGTTVVVTHHAPHLGSIHPRWERSPINPSFASDLSHLMGKAPLWIHGHMHDSFDYTVAGTRVVCNPKGYFGENKFFRPGLVIDVP